MLSTILCSSTSSLNSPGWSGSASLRLVAKSMRPVGVQSRFTTPLNSLLFLPLARLLISASGFAIAQVLHLSKRNFIAYHLVMTQRNAPALRPGLSTFLSLFLPVWKRNQSGVICIGLFCFRQNVANAYT